MEIHKRLGPFWFHAENVYEANCIPKDLYEKNGVGVYNNPDSIFLLNFKVRDINVGLSWYWYDLPAVFRIDRKINTLYRNK